MKCRDIDSLIISNQPGAAISSEVAAHLAGCEKCQRLHQALEQTPPVTPPSQERLEQIKSEILADLRRIEPLPPAAVLWFVILSILGVVVTVACIALGALGWHALGVLPKIAIFTTLATAASLLAFSANRQIVPGSRLRVSPYLSVVAVLVVVTGICAGLFHPHQESAFVSAGLACLTIGLGCASLAALLLWLLLRRGAILSPMMTGATLGVLAGLSGITVLEIHCPNLNMYHILAWHVGALLASTVGGVVVGAIAEYFGWRRGL